VGAVDVEVVGRVDRGVDLVELGEVGGGEGAELHGGKIPQVERGGRV
jgi:hypothetical protein